MTWSSTSAASILLPVVCGTACGSEPRARDERPILFLEEPGEGDDPVLDLHALARRADCRESPVANGPRPVELLEVLDVDELRLVTDRGEEIVALDGVRGNDPRLPAEVQSALAGPWRKAFRQWLAEPGTRLYEVPLALHRGEDRFPFPAEFDLHGRRRVALLRAGPIPEAEVDVAGEVVRRGWGRPEHAYQDFLATEPRLAYALSTPFADELLVAAELRDELSEDVLATAAIDPAELQELGERLHQEVADWLGWTPEEELEFRALDPEGAAEVFRPFVEADYDAVQAWVLGRVEDPAPEIDGPEEREADVDEIVAGLVATVHGYSPQGNTIYVLRKPEYSRAMLADVLVHEILHHYQEEVLVPPLYPGDLAWALAGHAYPPPMAPRSLLEAHAEYVAARFRMERSERYERLVALSDCEEVWLIAALVEASGLSADEVFQKLLAGEWDADAWTGLVEARLGLQEFLFRELGTTSFAGLAFAAVRDPDGALVRITNTAPSPFRGLFLGRWSWSTPEGERWTQETPPFNARISPGGDLLVRITDRDLWEEEPVGVIGLVSPTE